MALSDKVLKFAITFIFITRIIFQGNSKDLKISFETLFSNQKFILDQTYITPEGDTVEISVCKMYLTNFELKYKDGTIYTEQNSYHLLNLEYDSTLYWKLKDVPSGHIESIHFTIGIDSVTSCSGAMPGDLDPMYGMYWAWNSGYINAKIEGKSPSCDTRNNEFLFHIGGYKSKEATIQKVNFDLKKIKKNTLTLTMDLSAWFQNLDLSVENKVLMPGKEAVVMANRYANMFSVK